MCPSYETKQRGSAPRSQVVSQVKFVGRGPEAEFGLKYGLRASKRINIQLKWTVSQPEAEHSVNVTVGLPSKLNKSKYGSNLYLYLYISAKLTMELRG